MTRKLEVTPPSALIANLIDLLTGAGYFGAIEIGIAGGAVVAVRLLHRDEAGRMTELDIPLHELDRARVDPGGNVTIQ